jgi:hypothetical protein
MNETVLASIVGSGSALIGVFMTLWMSQRQLKITLQEERKKAKEERDFTAKHMAILAAVESVIRFYHYYLSLPDRELPTDGTIPDEVTEMGVSVSSLHFYCDLESIKYSMAMSQIFSEAYAKAVKAKMPIMFIIGDIKAIDGQILSFEKMNNQLQQEILALLPSNSSNTLVGALKQQVGTNFKTLADLNTRKNALIKEKYAATEVCRDVIKGDLRAVHESLRDVLLEARRELAFPIDEKAYADLINQSTDKALASIEQLYSEIRAQVKKKLGQV